jgi:hypothetical protein
LLLGGEQARTLGLEVAAGRDVAARDRAVELLLKGLLDRPSRWISTGNLAARAASAEVDPMADRAAASAAASRGLIGERGAAEKAPAAARRSGAFARASAARVASGMELCASSTTPDSRTRGAFSPSWPPWSITA